MDDSHCVTKEDVSRLKHHFYPLHSEPWNCVGRNVAMAEIMITVARTLFRFEVRRAPGSTVGCGRHELGWGCYDETQFQLVDVYISTRQGPEVQFRRRNHGSTYVV